MKGPGNPQEFPSTPTIPVTSESHWVQPVGDWARNWSNKTAQNIYSPGSVPARLLTLSPALSLEKREGFSQVILFCGFQFLLPSCLWASGWNIWAVPLPFLVLYSVHTSVNKNLCISPHFSLSYINETKIQQTSQSLMLCHWFSKCGPQSISVSTILYYLGTC